MSGRVLLCVRISWKRSRSVLIPVESLSASQLRDLNKLKEAAGPAVFRNMDDGREIHIDRLITIRHFFSYPGAPTCIIDPTQRDLSRAIDDLVSTGYDVEPCTNPLDRPVMGRPNHAYDYLDLKRSSMETCDHVDSFLVQDEVGGSPLGKDSRWTIHKTVSIE